MKRLRKGVQSAKDTLFTTAPVLVQPDPAQQFVVEVDASDIRCRKQSCPRDGGLTVSYIPVPSSPAASLLQRSIMMSVNRELLAVKMALEEWRHWLEGSTQPFVVWTDHKNLAYIQTAKRLNSRQARWALFFSRFDFTLTYRPGSRNIKPDALSRQFCVEEKVQEDENILPTSRVITAAISWDIENAILLAQQQQPDPGQGPPGRLFVPDTLSGHKCSNGPHSSKLLLVTQASTARSVSLSVISGGRKMEARYKGLCSGLHRLRQREKLSHQPPSGLLQPLSLSVPGRPWSHIALDFVTGLPPVQWENSHMTMTIVDRFSKTAHFVALTKLPTVRETADLLTNHVRTPSWHSTGHCVMDRWPAIRLSQVWRSFCKGLGASLRLLVSPPLKRCWVTNRHCFLTKNKSWQFHPSNIISNGVRQYGKGPRPPWRPPLRGISDRRTSTGHLPPSTPKEDQGGHSGLQEVQEDRAHFLSSSHGEAVEHVNNIKFLGIHIKSDLTWSMNTAHLLLFSFNTNHCTSEDPPVKLLKFAHEETVTGLIQGRGSPLSSSMLKNAASAVETFRFLGPAFSQGLRVESNFNTIGKAQQRMYFLTPLSNHLSSLAKT
ncbi:hypothetical protein L3Q82_009534 [Scortum barcoo]|uniref:Uncharacterized protein n=1 Tax=Scortum barcoo TaxID=214431 RepID=A0ACB8WGN9_9TELE|nr:hypothetical protein L3Q82_009534 [Scortum barcoo]